MTDATSPAPTDQLGQAIGDPCVEAVFARLPEINAMVATIGNIAATLRHADRDADPLYDGLDITATVRALNDVSKSLTASRPYAIAPDDVSERWRKRGWLTKRQLDQLARFKQEVSR